MQLRSEKLKTDKKDYYFLALNYNLAEIGMSLNKAQKLYKIYHLCGSIVLLIFLSVLD